MISRRTLLTAAAAMTATPTMAQPDPFAGLLNGRGDPKRQIPGYAAIAFPSATGTATTVRADGMASVDPPGLIMRLDSPMRIASISKVATTIGFMRLAEAGRVGLDDDVSELLKFTLRHPLFPDQPITPRMLLSHTSGLRDGPSYPVGLGRKLEDALTPGGKQWDDGQWFGPATEPPGGWFAYGNVNFAVIAQLIERMTGERFDLYMARRVFEPLGLTCGFNWSGTPQAVRRWGATVYRKAPTDEGPWDQAGLWYAQVDKPVPAAPEISVFRAPEGAPLGPDDYNEAVNGFLFSPQGGLRASARDLEVLARLIGQKGAVDDVRILKPETIALMATPQWRFTPEKPNGEGYGGLIRAYGLGLQILTEEGPDSLFPGCKGWIGHAGDAYGLVSGLWIDPVTGKGMVFLVNGTAAPLDEIRGNSRFTWIEEQLAKALSAG